MVWTGALPMPGKGSGGPGGLMDALDRRRLRYSVDLKRGIEPMGGNIRAVSSQSGRLLKMFMIS